MTITLGQSATLSWTSNGASCTASGAWSGTKSGSGSETVTPTATGDFTYTLTCTGGGYTESGDISAVLTVTAMSGFSQTDLVSGFRGSAALTTDSRLINPRGIAFAPGAPALVMNSRAAIAFDGNGMSQPAAGMLSSSVGAALNPVALDPTAIVANTTPDFVIAANGKSASAAFIYAGRNGMIGGWSPAVDRAGGVVTFAATDGAVYTGLALAETRAGNVLLAADFHNNKIDAFDASFTRQPAVDGFRDPALPAGFAPFGIQAIKNGVAGSTQVYVSYARQAAPDNRDSAIGAGTGLVNVFDASGQLLMRLIPAGGTLDAPWGMALAPQNFGSFSNALLVGNRGDGKINAFDVASGKFIGTMSDVDGRPLVNRGLWAIAFGNDSNAQPRNALFFTAGTDEADGMLGRIEVAGTAGH